MSIQEIVTYSGGALLILMTLVQITPIKINPWSAIGRALGNALNKDVIDKLEKVENRLNEHIDVGDERNADLCRIRVLRFNTELLKGIKHTKEEFDEILYNIECYEKYCHDHPDYKNNRMVHAIKNIYRVYDECMVEHSFL